MSKVVATKSHQLRAPNAAEQRGIQIAKTNQAKRPGRASLSLGEQEGEIQNLRSPHTDQEGWLLATREVFASTSEHFADDCILKLTKILGECHGGSGERPLNAALALIGGFEPANEAEAAIAVQIAGSHAVSTHLMVKALSNADAGYVPASEIFFGMATKASRTMVAQIEALAKLRGGGKQIIEHRYYQVNATNAVVGDHTQTLISTPGEENGNRTQSREPCALEHAPSAALPCPKQIGEIVPVSCDAGPKAMPTARRQKSRRT